MDNWTWDEGYKSLLCPSVSWGKHFIRNLLGDEYMDYDFNPYTLTVTDSADLVGNGETPDVCNLYAFCFGEFKRVYLTTLATTIGATDICFNLNDTSLEGYTPSKIIAINVRNLKPEVAPQVCGVYKCGSNIIHVNFEVRDLSECYPYLDNMVQNGVSKDFEYYSKVLMCSVPIMSIEDYKQFYKVCYLISSSDAYKSDGVSDDELDGVFESVDTSYLRLLEIAYNTGRDDSCRMLREFV